MARQAMIAAGRNRLTLGQDVRLLDAARDQFWLEGAVRLRPGQAIELVGRWPGVTGIEGSAGHARVVTWRVIRLTAAGPCYRGCCRLEP